MIKIKHICLVLFVLITEPSLGQARMNAEEQRAFQQHVEKEMLRIVSIKCDFDMQRYISVLREPIQASGVFLLKEQKMMLRYNSPQQNSIFLNQDMLYLLEENGTISTKDLNKNRKFRQLKRLIASMNGNTIFDESTFQFKFLKDATENIVIAQPKQKDLLSFIKEIILTFKQGEYNVSEIKIVEPTNDYIIFKLKNKKFNIVLSDSEFKL